MLDQVKEYNVKAFDGINSGIVKAEELHKVAEERIHDVLVQLVEKLGEKGEAIKLDELRARYGELVAKVFTGSKDLSDRASALTSDLISKIEARQAGEEVEVVAEEAAPQETSTEA